MSVSDRKKTGSEAIAMAVTMRFAGPADAELILGFIKALADYERQPDAVRVTGVSLRSQMSEAQPPFECLIAEVGGQPAGFALFFRSYSTWNGRPGLYLEDLFVSEHHRGRGAGKALLKRLAAIALERGWTRMEWSVLNWNAPAQGFYRALGAYPNQEWTVWRLDGAALAGAARE